MNTILIWICIIQTIVIIFCFVAIKEMAEKIDQNEEKERLIGWWRNEYDEFHS